MRPESGAAHRSLSAQRSPRRTPSGTSRGSSSERASRRSLFVPVRRFRHQGAGSLLRMHISITESHPPSSGTGQGGTVVCLERHPRPPRSPLVRLVTARRGPPGHLGTHTHTLAFSSSHPRPKPRGPCPGLRALPTNAAGTFCAMGHGIPVLLLPSSIHLPCVPTLERCPRVSQTQQHTAHRNDQRTNPVRRRLSDRH